MTEDTRSTLNLASLTGPPLRPYVSPIPRDGQIYDYAVTKEGLSEWVKWSECLKDVPPIPRDALYCEIIVPTIDTIRYTRLMHLLVTHQRACLFVGPTGTGKTAYITVSWLQIHSLEKSRYLQGAPIKIPPKISCR